MVASTVEERSFSPGQKKTEGDEEGDKKMRSGEEEGGRKEGRGKRERCHGERAGHPYSGTGLGGGNGWHTEQEGRQKTSRRGEK